jgi:hypothetical protein
MGILSYIKDMSVENLATLLVASMFGWRNTEPTIIEEEPEENNQDDELYFQVIETKDKEQEYFISKKTVKWGEDQFGLPQCTVEEETIPYWIYNDSKYLTSSGNNPVIFPAATISDQERSACGFMPEELLDREDPRIPDYYCWRFSGKGAKRRERNFHKWVGWIWRQKEHKNQLKIGWTKFWATYNQMKTSNQLDRWLTKKHISMIKKSFERFLT